MTDILTSPIDLVLDILGWLIWAPAMYAWWLMRQGQRKYRSMWRRALKITEEVQVENERLVGERDELLDLNQSLIKIIDEADAKWSKAPQAQVDVSRALLNQALQRKRDEVERKDAERRAQLMKGRDFPVADRYKRAMGRPITRQSARRLMRAWEDYR